MTGFLNIYKEAGDTSTFAVSRVKKLTHTPSGQFRA